VDGVREEGGDAPCPALKSLDCIRKERKTDHRTRKTKDSTTSEKVSEKRRKKQEGPSRGKGERKHEPRDALRRT